MSEDQISEGQTNETTVKKAAPSPDSLTKKDQHISYFSVVLSVIQASFGVQNHKNRERDFGEGSSIMPFIITAVVFTVLFVLALIFIVRLVLP